MGALCLDATCWCCAAAVPRSWLVGWLDACSRSTGVEIHGELEVGCRMLTMRWDECQMKGWTIANRWFQCDWAVSEASLFDPIRAQLNLLYCELAGHASQSNTRPSILDKMKSGDRDNALNPEHRQWWQPAASRPRSSHHHLCNCSYPSEAAAAAS